MLFSQQHLATFRNKTPALQQMGIFCNIVLGLLQNLFFLSYCLSIEYKTKPFVALVAAQKVSRARVKEQCV